MVTKSCTSLMRAKLILARVDLAVRIFPGVAAAPLLLGTLGGCGGRLLCDLVKHGWSRPEHPVNAELSNPAWVSRSAFLAAAVYYLGAYHFALVPPEQLAGLILTLKVRHAPGRGGEGGRGEGRVCGWWHAPCKARNPHSALSSKHLLSPAPSSLSHHPLTDV